MNIVGHIDLDAFFASVEERDNPWMKGYPIVIGADPHTGRGVVSTCNYKAREYGIHSAMSITEAWKHSLAAKKQGKQEAIFVTPKGRKYGAISKELFSYIQEVVPVVEQTSIDEAYLDLSFAKSYKKATLLAQKIRKDIKKKFRLTASIGIGPTRMIAKIAAQEEKPDGLCAILPRMVPKFLNPKSVRVIPGVGAVFGKKLSMLGIYTVADVLATPWETLEEKFGAHGISLFQKAHGMGSFLVQVSTGEQKSIGEEETFMNDTANLKYVVERLKGLVQDVLAHVEKRGVQSFQTVTLKIRFSDFETHTAQTTLRTPTKSERGMQAAALKLLLPYLERGKNPRMKDLRLLGVSVSKLLY